MKLNWESALLVTGAGDPAFGAINPRMLDINMLLFSTSDFICIGIGAAADAGDHQRRDRYLARLDHRPVRHRAGGDDAGGLADGGRHSADAAAGPAVRAGERGADSLHRHQPAGDHPRHALPLRRRRAAALRHGGATGYEGIGGFPDSFTAFANLTVLACRSRWCCSR
jgi:AI-2 transport system permease protein